jgi:hypothetical protein
MRPAKISAVMSSGTSDEVNDLLDPLGPAGSETWVLTKREENQLLVYMVLQTG